MNVMTIRRVTLLAFTSVVTLSLSGCVATVARSDPTVADHFQPLIGTRGSVHLIGQSARAAILRSDENGKSVSTEDAGTFLLMLIMFAADIPATAAVDLFILPLDLKTEAKKVMLPSGGGHAE
jgi:uncharacterized protein YceK